MTVSPEHALGAAALAWYSSNISNSRGNRFAARQDALELIRAAAGELVPASFSRVSPDDAPMDLIAPSAGHAACALVLSNFMGRWLSDPLQGPELWKARGGNRPAYRGQSVPWHITPRSWRQPVRSERALAAIRDYVCMFTSPEDAIELDLLGRPEDEFDLLGIAQHYGMPTSLVDFTFNPMIAIFFALGEHKGSDSIVELPPQHGVVYATTIFKLNAVGLPRWRFPPLPARRLYRQAGFFVDYGAAPENGVESFSFAEKWTRVEENCIRIFFPRTYPIAAEASYWNPNVILTPDSFFEEVVNAAVEFSQTDLEDKPGAMAAFVGFRVTSRPPWRVKNALGTFIYTDDEFIEIGAELEQYLTIAGAVQVGTDVRLDPLLIANLAGHDKRILQALRQIQQLPGGVAFREFEWITGEIATAIDMAISLGRGRSP
jgi:hypothetical protein